MNKPHDTPSDVSAQEGEVLVEGPDGVAVSLTPDAAIETADRLHSAGAQAHGQVLVEQIRKRRPGAPDA